MSCLWFVVLALLALCSCTANIGHRKFEYKYSFKGPYLAQKDGSVPFWDYSGSEYRRLSVDGRAYQSARVHVAFSRARNWNATPLQSGMSKEDGSNGKVLSEFRTWCFKAPGTSWMRAAFYFHVYGMWHIEPVQAGKSWYSRPAFGLVRGWTSHFTVALCVAGFPACHAVVTESHGCWRLARVSAHAYNDS